MIKKQTTALLSRITAFDLLRGYFLIAIINDHLAFFPNGLDWIGMHGSLYVTAAEGFFLLSGIVLGIVRGARLIDQPFAKVSKLLLGRGLKIYITSFILIISFTLLAWLLYSGDPAFKDRIAPVDTNIWVLVWNTLTFQYYYGWADYLRLYAIFLFISPVIFLLLRKGYWWLVLVASFTVWGGYQFMSLDPSFQQAKFQYISWQLLFFGGAVIGFYWPKFKDWWHKINHKIRKNILITVVGIAIITAILNLVLVLNSYGYINISAVFSEQLRTYLYDNFFNKEQIPLPRIMLFLLWFFASFIVVKRYEKAVKKYIGWLLLPFGQNSLYVYTIHAFLIFFAHLYFLPTILPINLLVYLLVVGIIYTCVRFKFLMGIIPR